MVVTRKMPAAVEAEIASRYDALFNKTDLALAPEQLKQVLQQADIVMTTVTDRWTEEIFNTPGIRARMLCNVGMGVNHINVAAAKRAGMTISNTPDVVTDDTADIAIALMLMTMRRLGEGERHVRGGAWGGLRPTFMLGRTLRGKTLGIGGVLREVLRFPWIVECVEQTLNCLRRLPNAVVASIQFTLLPCLLPCAPATLTELIKAVRSRRQMRCETTNVFPTTIGDSSAHAINFIKSIGIKKNSRILF